MRLNARMLFALALLPVAACSTNPPPVASAPPPPPALASADQTFINMAAAGDAGEIQSAQLAQTKAHRPAVKKFAAQMISDHTATTQQLTTIAQSKGATPTATPSESAQDSMAKLEADRSATFDRAYVRGQVVDHQKMVQAYQDEIANGQDADLKAFAQQTLPTVEKHLHEAQALSGRRG